MKKDEISYEVFSQLDVRVGEIVTAVPVEGSEKLLELSIDLGEEWATITVLSGIAQWYSPEKLIGLKTLVLANLAPRPMMGKISQGMLLAIDGGDEAKLITLDPELANGANLC